MWIMVAVRTAGASADCELISATLVCSFMGIPACPCLRIHVCVTAATISGTAYCCCNLTFWLKEGHLCLMFHQLSVAST